MSNIVYIAAAGSGKTTKLVKMAIEKSVTERVLITTYTNANEQEIKRKFYQLNSCIPKNVTIQSWFSFLIQHGVKPYQDYLSQDLKTFDIRGMILVSKQSALYMKESDTKKYYFTKSQKIYSDKLSKFVYKCNEVSNGKVLERITKVFKNIYIDEVQDLAGYDLEIIKLLFNSSSNIIITGDPRQTTYLTHHEKKNCIYNYGKIIQFLKDNRLNYDIDELTLNGSFRCNKMICEYASILNMDLPKTFSNCDYGGIKQGVFLIRESDVYRYLQEYNAIQLRYDRRTDCHNDFPIYNFGESKGLTFDNVLIYPTSEIIKWIENHVYNLKDSTRSKFYVALTRARYNVCVVWKKKNCNVNDIVFWDF